MPYLQVRSLSTSRDVGRCGLQLYTLRRMTSHQELVNIQDSGCHVSPAPDLTGSPRPLHLEKGIEKSAVTGSCNRHSDSLNSLTCYKSVQGSLHCKQWIDCGEQLTKGLGQKVTKSAVPSHAAHPFSVPSHTCIHVNGTRSDSSRGTVLRS